MHKDISRLTKTIFSITYLVECYRAFDIPSVGVVPISQEAGVQSCYRRWGQRFADLTMLAEFDTTYIYTNVSSIYTNCKTTD